jgi:subtilisin family serine protease
MTLIFILTLVLNANDFYYYDSYNNKVYPKTNYKNYLSFDEQDYKKVESILASLKIKIIEKNNYKDVSIIKLDKEIDKEEDLFSKEKIKLYKYFGELNTWPIVIINRGVITLNNGFDIKKLSQEFNFEIISYMKTIDLYIIKTEFDILPLLNELKEKNIAKNSQPDFLIPHEKRFIPNDTYFDSQWHLGYSGELTNVVSTANISAPDAWDIEMGNPDITIAIVDDGMDVNHPDLSGKIRAKHDFLGNDEDVGNNGDDAGIHGTACAGVSAAIGDNNEGVIGSCPNCSLISARMIGSSPSSNYNPATLDAQAIIWSSGGLVEDTVQIKGADVISCSWGFSQPTTLPYSLKQGIDWSVTNGRDGKGCVVLFASGNDGREYNETELEAYQNIITVGASNDTDKRSYYSNYGEKLDLLAPSNGGANGIWTTDYQGRIGYNQGMQGPDLSGNYTKTFGGTSSATPLVSGVVGLILSKNYDLKWNEVRDILRASCDKINKNRVSYVNGWNKQYGYGRLNAYTALKLTSTDTFNDISENCEEDSDCYFSCIPKSYGWKDGYCTKECSYDYCLEGSICVDNISGQNTPLCLKTCISIESCKEGYSCSKLNEDDNLTYCIPGCSFKGCREDFKICNLETELCEDDVNNLCWNKESSSPKICMGMHQFCNQETGDCECHNEYIKSDTDVCVKNLCLEHDTCVENSECEPITGLCICDDGYVKDKGNCIIYKAKKASTCNYSDGAKNDMILLLFIILFIFYLKRKLSSLNF